MWVFGYGSLMWDGWEAERDCLRRVTAELRGYARAFNKLSVRNWGTRLHPGPTLNLIPADSLCIGIAFEFSETSRGDIRAHLLEREGKNFNLNEQPIVLEDTSAVMALVPLYGGKNVLPAARASEVVGMALKANGTSGSCASYINAVFDHLSELGINDPAVSEVHKALQRQTQV